jgi:hypothetical protein
MKDITFIDFIRTIGKHITVNYMMSKDSVKKRFADDSREGMSFTEFSYQLMQGYDFYWLRKNRNVKLQMGGADQWGNITTGTELIRRIDGQEAEAFGLTCPLIKKADGTKFGKTEKGNVWLDARYTTPYEFYQFWINTSDEDAERYIKIYTMLTRDEIEALIAKHREDPGRRLLQGELAKRITIMVHGEDAYNQAIAASQILFGKGTKEQLLSLDEQSFLAVFAGVPQYSISAAELKNGIGILDIVENRLVGMKSRGVYETPAGTILYKAHDVLETITLDKETVHFKAIVAQKLAELVYNGQWFTPLREAIGAFVDDTQKTVTGDVKLKLYKGNIINAGVTSPYSLYNEQTASFGEDDDYNQADAAGFINLYGLPIKVRAQAQKNW